jgi:D-amino-acid oxidase
MPPKVRKLISQRLPAGFQDRETSANSELKHGALALFAGDREMNDNLRLTRRGLMQGMAAGLGAVAVFGAAGCAPATSTLKPAIPPPYPRPYSRMPWAAPRISMDAVIRSVVGHRPFRPKGFRVEREQFDDRIVVHNYGHGGGGLSLGWGSSALAMHEVAGMTPGDVAVIGSGIMGLCSARLLQDAGWSATIYARDVYRHTTSNVAAGEWDPFSTFQRGQVDEVFMARLDWAARVSHHAYTNLTGPKYGIRWLESYALSDTPHGEGKGSSFDDLFPYKANLKPGEHPFGNRYARRSVTMQIDPGTLLRQLTADFQLAGGKIIIRTFANLDEVLSLPEPVIFNCSGLGAASLFKDEGLVPAKGQLVYLPPDPAVDYFTFGGGKPGDGFMHMFPRGDVLLLGGYFKQGDESRTVEPDETERMVLQHQELFASFG